MSLKERRRNIEGKAIMKQCSCGFNTPFMNTFKAHLDMHERVEREEHKGVFDILPNIDAIMGTFPLRGVLNE